MKYLGTLGDLSDEESLKYTLSSNPLLSCLWLLGICDPEEIPVESQCYIFVKCSRMQCNMEILSSSISCYECHSQLVNTKEGW